ncbi:MAG: PAS domain-containing protein [Gammaproteobacteria bacterium]
MPLGGVEDANELNAELARARRRLNVIAERYALATAAAKVGVWEWDLQSGDFYLDPNIKAFLGFQDHEIPNDIEAWNAHLHPDDREKVMRATQAAIEGRASEFACEHRMLHRDGSVRWMMVRGQVISDRQARPYRFVGTNTDITEKRELERQVLELSNDVQTRIGHDLHDSLGRELTTLSFRLRNIQRAITDETSAAAHEVRQAQTLTERAFQLTESLSRGLSPVLSGESLALSMGQLAQDVGEVYGVDCEVNLPDALPMSLSRSFGNELYRIAQEAVLRAIRLGKAAHIHIEGRIVNRQFLLNVTDDGIGLSTAEDPARSLRIMQFRARHLGGSLTISQRRDGGTLIVCACPLPR